MIILGRQLAEWTDGRWINGVPDRVGEIVFDSRLMRPNSDPVFIAMSHGERDGHDFIDAAISAGAVACIVEREMAVSIPQLVVPSSLKALGKIGESVRDLYSGTLIGVTGSCGKTSTKHLLKAALGTERTSIKSGNWNNQMGVALSLYALRESTSQFAIIEAGISERGEMTDLSAMIKPDLCVITSVGKAHLEGLENLAIVAEEKSKLMQFAREEASLIAPESVLSLKPFQRYRDRAIGVVESNQELELEAFGHRFIYSYESAEDFESRVRLKHCDQSLVFNIRTSSVGMIQNAVLAIAAAVNLGLPMEKAAQGIESWEPEGNRGAILKVGQSLFYKDCYNANPTSMLDALLAFKLGTQAYTHKLYILGAMNELGADAESLHQGITRGLPPEGNTQLIFIGPEALTSAYRQGALSAGWDQAAVHSYDSVKYVKSVVENFSGAVFLKGSRTCHLEVLIPNNP